MRLIGFANQHFAPMGNGRKFSEDQISNEEILVTLQGTIQEVYLTLAVVFIHFNLKMKEIISKQNLQKISINQYSKLNAVFSEISNVENELNIRQKLEKWTNSKAENLKEFLSVLEEEYTLKFNFNPLLEFKSQNGRSNSTKLTFLNLDRIPCFFP